MYIPLTHGWRDRFPNRDTRQLHRLRGRVVMLILNNLNPYGVKVVTKSSLFNKYRQVRNKARNREKRSLLWWNGSVPRLGWYFNTEPFRRTRKQNFEPGPQRAEFGAGGFIEGQKNSWTRWYFRRKRSGKGRVMLWGKNATDSCLTRRRVSWWSGEML